MGEGSDKGSVSMTTSFAATKTRKRQRTRWLREEETTTGTTTAICDDDNNDVTAFLLVQQLLHIQHMMQQQQEQERSYQSPPYIIPSVKQQNQRQPQRHYQITGRRRTASLGSAPASTLSSLLSFSACLAAAFEKMRIREATEANVLLLLSLTSRTAAATADVTDGSPFLVGNHHHQSSVFYDTTTGKQFALEYHPMDSIQVMRNELAPPLSESVESEAKAVEFISATGPACSWQYSLPLPVVLLILLRGHNMTAATCLFALSIAAAACAILGFGVWCFITTTTTTRNSKERGRAGDYASHGASHVASYSASGDGGETNNDTTTNRQHQQRQRTHDILTATAAAIQKDDSPPRAAAAHARQQQQKSPEKNKTQQSSPPPPLQKVVNLNDQQQQKQKVHCQIKGGGGNRTATFVSSSPSPSFLFSSSPAVCKINRRAATALPVLLLLFLTLISPAAAAETDRYTSLQQQTVFQEEEEKEQYNIDDQSTVFLHETPAIFEGAAAASTRFLSGMQDLQQCYDEMIASDVNQDYQLSSQEFISFAKAIMINDDAAIDDTVATFEQLPEEYIAAYTYTTCLCRIPRFGGNASDVTCCFGASKSHIRIPPTGPNDAATSLTDLSYLVAACSFTTTAGDSLVKATTSPPTPAPSVRSRETPPPWTPPPTRSPPTIPPIITAPPAPTQPPANGDDDDSGNNNNNTDTDNTTIYEEVDAHVSYMILVQNPAASNTVDNVNGTIQPVVDLDYQLYLIRAMNMLAPLVAFEVFGSTSTSQDGRLSAASIVGLQLLSTNSSSSGGENGRTRNLRSRQQQQQHNYHRGVDARRQLEVAAMLPTSLDTLTDVYCPNNVTYTDTVVHSCQMVSAIIAVIVSDEDDPEQAVSTFEAAIDIAIRQGRLQASLESIDASGVVQIIAANDMSPDAGDYNTVHGAGWYDPPVNMSPGHMAAIVLVGTGLVIFLGWGAYKIYFRGVFGAFGNKSESGSSNSGEDDYSYLMKRQPSFKDYQMAKASKLEQKQHKQASQGSGLSSSIPTSFEAKCVGVVGGGGGENNQNQLQNDSDPYMNAPPIEIMFGDGHNDGTMTLLQNGGHNAQAQQQNREQENSNNNNPHKQHQREPLLKTSMSGKRCASSRSSSSRVTFGSVEEWNDDIMAGQQQQQQQQQLNDEIVDSQQQQLQPNNYILRKVSPTPSLRELQTQLKQPSYAQLRLQNAVATAAAELARNMSSGKTGSGNSSRSAASGSSAARSSNSNNKQKKKKEEIKQNPGRPSPSPRNSHSGNTKSPGSSLSSSGSLSCERAKNTNIIDDDTLQAPATSPTSPSPAVVDAAVEASEVPPSAHQKGMPNEVPEESAPAASTNPKTVLRKKKKVLKKPSGKVANGSSLQSSLHASSSSFSSKRHQDSPTDATNSIRVTTSPKGASATTQPPNAEAHSNVQSVKSEVLKEEPVSESPSSSTGKRRIKKVGAARKSGRPPAISEEQQVLIGSASEGVEGASSPATLKKKKTGLKQSSSSPVSSLSSSSVKRSRRAPPSSTRKNSSVENAGIASPKSDESKSPKTARKSQFSSVTGHIDGEQLQPAEQLERGSDPMVSNKLVSDSSVTMEHMVEKLGQEKKDVVSDSATARVTMSPGGENSQRSLIDVTISQIDTLIEAGNWDAAEEAVLFASTTACDVGQNSQMGITFGTDDETPRSHASELYHLVDAGDWDSVVLLAAKLAEEVRTQSPVSIDSGMLSNSQPPQKLSDLRREVERLVANVLPDEIDNVNDMMKQFEGREKLLVETLKIIEERSLNSGRVTLNKSIEVSSAPVTPETVVENTESYDPESEGDQKKADIRNQVKVLLARVIPEEFDNLEKMLKQFEGREQDLVNMLLTIEERSRDISRTFVESGAVDSFQTENATMIAAPSNQIWFQSVAQISKKGRIRAQIEKLVAEVLPDKIDEINDLLERYEGREESLLKSLQKIKGNPGLSANK